MNFNSYEYEPYDYEDTEQLIIKRLKDIRLYLIKKESLTAEGISVFSNYLEGLEECHHCSLYEIGEIAEHFREEGKLSREEFIMEMGKIYGLYLAFDG